MKQQSFEKFYYSKVATGEGCGCAERVIDIHEFNRLAGRNPGTNPSRPIGLLSALKRLFTGSRK